MIWMALGGLMASRFSQSAVVSNHFDDCGSTQDDVDLFSQRRDSDTASSSYGNATVTSIATTSGNSATTSMAYLPQTIVLCELRHDAFEASTPTGPSDIGLVSKWRPKDRVSPCFELVFLECCCKLYLQYLIVLLGFLFVHLIC